VIRRLKTHWDQRFAVRPNTFPKWTNFRSGTLETGRGGDYKTKKKKKGNRQKSKAFVSPAEGRDGRFARASSAQEKILKQG